ncbi:hypothetical protein B0H66DRAFT_555814 [Apodospora peruviana]|uniref:F-box domain-containing protein n=1 Tax=Apodospora peruviana TaxID=516989 RepID=A0AAE0I3F3_9PEZI|nr:hypothetical protein B0H66DRAFT_555814 [Apodospora peruviana]
MSQTAITMDPSRPSLIALLPQELLDNIVAHLNPRAMARLGQCSKHLGARLEHVLYAHEDNRNQAMAWACKHGVMGTIDRALSYGASVSAVCLPPPMCATSTAYKTLTLYLAAKHNQPDTFRHLLDLGATVDVDDEHGKVDPFTVRGLARSLCRRPANIDLFLRPFLGPPSNLLTRFFDQITINHVFLDLLRFADQPGTVPLDIVQTVLDDSRADPNYVRSDKGDRVRKTFMAPLSAAVLARRSDIFRLLVERGAHVSAEPRPRHLALPHRPLHVPVLAAAYAMATTTTTTSKVEEDASIAMMQLCLDYGADINVRVPFVSDDRSCRAMMFTTPLLTFLTNVPEWTESAVTKLEYLLDHGVSVTPEQPLDEWERTDETLMVRHRGTYWGQSTSTPVELLLDKWTVRQLASGHFLSALRLLVRHGALRTNTAEILAHYDCLPPIFLAWVSPCDVTNPTTDTGRARKEEHDAVVSAWEDLLSTLLSDKSYYHQDEEDLDTFLYTYITTRALFGGNHHDRQPVAHLARATVSCLVAAGADINARRKPMHIPTGRHTPAPPPGETTALLELVWLFSKATEPKIARFSFPSAPLDYYVSKDRADFVKWLVDRFGGTNAVAAEWDGRNMVDILRTGLGRDSGYGEKLMLIRGEERALVDKLIKFLEGWLVSKTESGVGEGEKIKQ